MIAGSDQGHQGQHDERLHIRVSFALEGVENGWTCYRRLQRTGTPRNRVNFQSSPRHELRLSCGEPARRCIFRTPRRAPRTRGRRDLYPPSGRLFVNMAKSNAQPDVLVLGQHPCAVPRRRASCWRSRASPSRTRRSPATRRPTAWSSSTRSFFALHKPLEKIKKKLELTPVYGAVVPLRRPGDARRVAQQDRRRVHRLLQRHPQAARRAGQGGRREVPRPEVAQRQPRERARVRGRASTRTRSSPRPSCSPGTCRPSRGRCSGCRTNFTAT